MPGHEGFVNRRFCESAFAGADAPMPCRHEEFLHLGSFMNDEDLPSCALSEVAVGQQFSSNTHTSLQPR